MRAGDVGALADVHEQRVVADVERLEAGEAQARARSSAPRAAEGRDRLGDRLDVRGRGAAAAAGDVDEAALARNRGCSAAVCSGDSSYRSASGFGRPAFGYAQTYVSAMREISSMYGRICLRAERAVQADRERLRVAHRIPERLGRLAGERAAGGVGDRAGDHDRQADAGLLAVAGRSRTAPPWRSACRRWSRPEADRRRLRRARATRFGVGVDQLVEATCAKARVVHVGRDRGGAVRRAERAGDEARPRGVCALEPVGRRAREAARLRGSARARRPPGRNRPARSRSS